MFPRAKQKKESMSPITRVAVTLFFSAVLSCRSSLSPTSGDKESPPIPSVCVSVTVDWEGAELSAADLQKVASFRRDWPQIPLTHFLNAAYYTRSATDPEEITSSIWRVVRPEDETGLHVHAWESLVKTAVVFPRQGPSFLSDELVDFGFDRGFEVELESYAEAEVHAIIRAAKRILEDQHFSISGSFRAGGWMAGSRVLRAAKRLGFAQDSSATPSGWYNELSDRLLPGRLAHYWPDLEPLTQPFWIDLGLGERILELPASGAAADYATAKEMIDHLRDAKALSAKKGGETYAQIGFHLEGAAGFVGRIWEVVAKLQPDSAFRFSTIQDCAARAKKSVVEVREPAEYFPGPEDVERILDRF